MQSYDVRVWDLRKRTRTGRPTRFERMHYWRHLNCFAMGHMRQYYHRAGACLRHGETNLEAVDFPANYHG